MMRLLISILSALLATGFALRCEECSAVDAVTCTGHYETCQPYETRCMTRLTEKSLGHGTETVRIMEVVKSCGKVYDCTHPATLTSSEFQVRVTTECCDDDFCNNSTIAWNKANSTLNGVTCVSCFAKNSNKCDKKTPMECAGDEMYCVQFSASRQEGSPVTVAGCASETMKKSQGRAAFPGSSVAVESGAGTSSNSWKHNTYLLPLLALLALLWTISQ